MQRLVPNSIWNKRRRDGWYVTDLDAFVTIFEETLKDHNKVVPEAPVQIMEEWMAFYIRFACLNLSDERI